MDELKDIKLKNYHYLNEVAIKGETLFTGSSLMELFPICEIARSRGIDDIIYNRGISGLNTDEFLQHIHPLLLNLQPSKVFINIGTNDMTEEPYGDQWFQHMTANISQILEQTLAILPHTKIYLMAFYLANLHLPWQTPASIQWMPVSATLLIVMLSWSMIGKSRRMSTPMTASTFMPMLT